MKYFLAFILATLPLFAFGSSTRNLNNVSTITASGGVALTVPTTGTAILSTASNIPVNGSFYYQTFSCNGSTTAFTLTYAPAGSASTFVYLDGIRETLTTDYSVSSSTLTLTTACASGQTLSVQYSRY